jgi:hypothetical protein
MCAGFHIHQPMVGRYNSTPVTACFRNRRVHVAG